MIEAAQISDVSFRYTWLRSRTWNGARDKLTLVIVRPVRRLDFREKIGTGP